MTSKEFKPPKCIECNIEMELKNGNEKMLTFICPTEDCKEMTDVLTIYIDRDDPILKQIPSWKDLL